MPEYGTTAPALPGGHKNHAHSTKLSPFYSALSPFFNSVLDRMPEETSYHLIKILEANPETTQRELAQQMGISLGKTNYCLKGLMEKGIIKAQNFKNSKNKLAYAYLLTPQGIEEKSRITARFLKRRLAEYEHLKQEIKILQEEVQGHTDKK